MCKPVVCEALSKERLLTIVYDAYHAASETFLHGDLCMQALTSVPSTPAPGTSLRSYASAAYSFDSRAAPHPRSPDAMSAANTCGPAAFGKGGSGGAPAASNSAVHSAGAMWPPRPPSRSADGTPRAGHMASPFTMSGDCGMHGTSSQPPSPPAIAAEVGTPLELPPPVQLQPTQRDSPCASAREDGRQLSQRRASEAVSAGSSEVLQLPPSLPALRTSGSGERTDVQQEGGSTAPLCPAKLHHSTSAGARSFTHSVSVASQAEGGNVSMPLAPGSAGIADSMRSQSAFATSHSFVRSVSAASHSVRHTDSGTSRSVHHTDSGASRAAVGPDAEQPVSRLLGGDHGAGHIAHKPSTVPELSGSLSNLSLSSAGQRQSAGASDDDTDMAEYPGALQAGTLAALVVPGVPDTYASAEESVSAAGNPVATSSRSEGSEASCGPAAGEHNREVSLMIDKHNSGAFAGAAASAARRTSHTNAPRASANAEIRLAAPAEPAMSRPGEPDASDSADTESMFQAWRTTSAPMSDCADSQGGLASPRAEAAADVANSAAINDAVSVAAATASLGGASSSAARVTLDLPQQCAKSAERSRLDSGSSARSGTALLHSSQREPSLVSVLSAPQPSGEIHTVAFAAPAAKPAGAAVHMQQSASNGSLQDSGPPPGPALSSSTSSGAPSFDCDDLRSAEVTLLRRDSRRLRCSMAALATADARASSGIAVGVSLSDNHCDSGAEADVDLSAGSAGTTSAPMPFWSQTAAAAAAPSTEREALEATIDFAPDAATSGAGAGGATDARNRSPNPPALFSWNRPRTAPMSHAGGTATRGAMRHTSMDSMPEPSAFDLSGRLQSTGGSGASAELRLPQGVPDLMPCTVPCPGSPPQLPDSSDGPGGHTSAAGAATCDDVDLAAGLSSPQPAWRTVSPVDSSPAQPTLSLGGDASGRQSHGHSNSGFLPLDDSDNLSTGNGGHSVNFLPHGAAPEGTAIAAASWLPRRRSSTGAAPPTAGMPSLCAWHLLESRAPLWPVEW